jgi:hypothetical protein
MNIQSNANCVSLETVAFLVAVDQIYTPRSQMLMIDKVLDLVMSPTLTSYQRTLELRRILAASQSTVVFDGVFDDGQLDPVVSRAEKLDEINSSSISTIDVDDMNAWIKTCKSLGVSIVSSHRKLRK